MTNRIDNFIQSKWDRITNETPRQYWNHAFRCYYAADQQFRIKDEEIEVIKQLWTSDLTDPVDKRDYEEHHKWALRYFALYQADKPDTYIPEDSDEE